MHPRRAFRFLLLFSWTSPWVLRGPAASKTEPLGPRRPLGILLLLHFNAKPAVPHRATGSRTPAKPRIEQLHGLKEALSSPRPQRLPSLRLTLTGRTRKGRGSHTARDDWNSVFIPPRCCNSQQRRGFLGPPAPLCLRRPVPDRGDERSALVCEGTLSWARSGMPTTSQHPRSPRKGPRPPNALGSAPSKDVLGRTQCGRSTRLRPWRLEGEGVVSWIRVTTPVLLWWLFSGVTTLLRALCASPPKSSYKFSRVTRTCFYCSKRPGLGSVPRVVLAQGGADASALLLLRR